DADVILHIRDISHPETEEQAQDVIAILSELGVTEDRQDAMIEVLNKTDLLGPEALEAVQRRTERAPLKMAASGLTGAGVPELLALIEATLEAPKISVSLTLDFAQGKARAWLFEQNVVIDETQSEEGYRLEVEWTEAQAARFEALTKEEA
ncbi:MAG: GTPase HflX, partial [Pseudomonadota bacterium]